MSHRLQLDASKTELIWFGSRSSLSRLKSEDCTLEIGATVVKPIDVVRDLGVLLQSELTMKRPVSKMVSTCFYHLCLTRVSADLTRLRQTVPYCRTGNREGSISKLSSCPCHSVEQ